MKDVPVRLFTCALPVLLTVLLAATAASAAIWVVRPDGLGSAPTIQAAVDASGDGDEIWLTDGVFTGPGNRDVDLRDRNVLIRSLYDDPAACIIDCAPAGPADSHRAFLFADTAVQLTVIRGITMRNGYHENGGGAVLIIAYASPKFENCVFEDDATGMTDWHGGGAVYVDHGGSPRFDGCVFRRNQAFAGGALTANHGGRVTFLDCTFEANHALRGGALYGITTEKIGCLFVGNTAELEGGAIWHNSFLVDSYESCTFDGNGAPVGGAVYANANYGYAMEMSRTIISGCTAGGSMAVAGSVPLTITCSDFYGNEGGDWIAPFAAQVDERGNFSANPCYCGPEAGDYHLSADSYARAGGHPWGCADLVGAFGVGCGETGCSGPVATENLSFGTFKALYR